MRLGSICQVSGQVSECVLSLSWWAFYDQRMTWDFVEETDMKRLDLIDSSRLKRLYIELEDVIPKCCRGES